MPNRIGVGDRAVVPIRSATCGSELLEQVVVALRDGGR
jgi:hypothetical protein